MLSVVSMDSEENKEKGKKMHLSISMSCQWRNHMENSQSSFLGDAMSYVLSKSLLE